MNILAKNKSGHLYLMGIWMDPDGAYIVSTYHLHPNGSLRTKGGSSSFKDKESAINKCFRMLRIKQRTRGYYQVALSELPELSYSFLKPDVDKYLSSGDAEQMVKEALLERYVEFNCVAGIEERFDEDVEYLALQDELDKDFYYVWDRYGQQCHCHKERFSRLEKTERAIKMTGMCLGSV